MQKVRTLLLNVWSAGGQLRPARELVRKADSQSPAQGRRNAIPSHKLFNFGEAILHHDFEAANSTTIL